ncbi:MAG: shikimate dehydrogenase [Rothia sp. (in: high G+C Gram-positive bacteria)]|nr:shikimate dehydrogenase [Rothia sp. (in: high G+C Gram-positive bacteria)]
MSTINESYLVGLIGSGITESLTPIMHEFAADELNIRYLYRPLNIDSLGPQHTRIRPKDCGELLRQGLNLGYNAFNITHPCKQLIIEHLDELSEDARRLNAVNTVVIRDGKTVGHNTDHSGFAAALASGLAPDGEDLHRVLQLGTGGAGSATAYALLNSGVQTLFLCDLSIDRAEHCATNLQTLFPHQKVRVVPHHQLPALVGTLNGIVNATPLGMHHHPGSPLDLTLIRAHHWVADIIYLPQNTPLIVHAQNIGARTMSGGLMTVGQAVDAFELITGIRLSAQHLSEYFTQLTKASHN